MENQIYQAEAKFLFSRLQQKYSFKKLSPAFHRLLVHGAQFLDHYQKKGIPLGVTSEAAIETRNRENKIARLSHARKTDRKSNLSDTYNWLLASSDPYLSEKRRKFCQKKTRGRKKKPKVDNRVKGRAHFKPKPMKPKNIKPTKSKKALFPQ